jgi:hypothetical protein
MGLMRGDHNMHKGIYKGCFYLSAAVGAISIGIISARLSAQTATGAPVPFYYAKPTIADLPFQTFRLSVVDLEHDSTDPMGDRRMVTAGNGPKAAKSQQFQAYQFVRNASGFVGSLTAQGYAPPEKPNARNAAPPVARTPQEAAAMAPSILDKPGLSQIASLK